MVVWRKTHTEDILLFSYAHCWCVSANALMGGENYGVRLAQIRFISAGVTQSCVKQDDTSWSKGRKGSGFTRRQIMGFFSGKKQIQSLDVYSSACELYNARTPHGILV